MQREEIIEKLREQGCRITRQRRILLDVILEEECSCCKELYYKASRIDRTIGIATVYRMINTLEEIGAISRNTMYKIACPKECEIGGKCQVELDDGTKLKLTPGQWDQIIASGLRACGYMGSQKVKHVSMEPCL